MSLTYVIQYLHNVANSKIKDHYMWWAPKQNELSIGLLSSQTP